MRRNDREIPAAQAYEIVDNSAYATLSTTNEDGTPYGVPLNVVREGETLYFHCAKDGKKTDNLRSRKDVCITCVGEVVFPANSFTTYFSSVIITGPAREVMDENEKLHALRLICERYTPANMQRFEKAAGASLQAVAVFAVDMQSITGKRHAPPHD